jgi:hypothetical protein
MAFKDVRRQRFLGETRSTEFAEDLLHDIQSSRPKIGDESRHVQARSSYAWAVASESLQLLILRYTAGHPVRELSEEWLSVISAFDAFIPLDQPAPNEAHTLTITQHEAYVYVFWLLALSTLLGHREAVPRILGWLDQHREYNRGRDTLFEQVVGKLTGSMDDPGRYVLHPVPYRPLGRAILAEKPEDRPSLIKEFLDGWYKGSKDCYWHGTHLDGEASRYFGYWSFEAALVTYLWNSDDTMYRDHEFYPKDLVDYARRHFPYSGPISPVPDSTLRCEAGQPCPREGWWLTPAKAGSRRHFQQGELMPDMHSDTWATIWQWDSQQGE